jgi:hypothetical protein
VLNVFPEALHVGSQEGGRQIRQMKYFRGPTARRLTKCPPMLGGDRKLNPNAPAQVLRTGEPAGTRG